MIWRVLQPENRLKINKIEKILKIIEKTCVFRGGHSEIN